MKKFYGEFVRGRAAMGLLLLRLFTGAALMMHGWPKAQKPFSWMGDGPGSAPGFLQALAALSEFGGGLALVLGLLTPLACLGIICTMGYAILTAHKGQPWITTNPKAHPFEAASFYLALAVFFIITGPGALSMDANIFGKKRF
jgi:putative oxidoreductase